MVVDPRLPTREQRGPCGDVVRADPNLLRFGRFLTVFLIACGGATAPVEHPDPQPEPEPESAQVTPRVRIANLEAPSSGAPFIAETEGDEVELELGPNVEGTLQAGTHSRADIRNALFYPRGSWTEFEVGQRRVRLRGDNAVVHWLQSLELHLSEGQHSFLEGSPHEVGSITVVESLWEARVRILGTLLLPEAEPWARDAWATYQLALRKPGGVDRLVDNYVAHRANTGIPIHQDQAGAFWASFCVDIARQNPSENLSAWGDRREVIDVDLCLSHLNARIVAHVVPVYDAPSIRRFFRGATVEGTPPTVVRSPGPLRPGDVITHVRGQRLENLDLLGRSIGTLEPRHRVSIAVQRGEQTIRMWLRVPTMEVIREDVLFEIDPDPSEHPRWPFRVNPGDR